MKSEDSYEVVDALDALNEKCLDGYRIAMYFDPRDGTSWLTWAPPGAAVNSEAGRGLHGVIFERDVFTQGVRQLILDIERIRSLKEFRDHHVPPTE